MRSIVLAEFCPTIKEYHSSESGWLQCRAAQQRRVPWNHRQKTQQHSSGNENTRTTDTDALNSSEKNCLCLSPHGTWAALAGPRSSVSASEARHSHGTPLTSAAARQQ
jgi:hypothetical protein